MPSEAKGNVKTIPKTVLLYNADNNVYKNIHFYINEADNDYIKPEKSSMMTLSREKSFFHENNSAEKIVILGKAKK